MQQFSKWNKGYRYLLMVLDVFSKYGWIVPLKDKKGETVAEALKNILKEGRKPQYLWVDKGREYYNKHVKELLNKNKITLYSTENEEKSSGLIIWVGLNSNSIRLMRSTAFEPGLSKKKKRRKNKKWFTTMKICSIVAYFQTLLSQMIHLKQKWKKSIMKRDIDELSAKINSRYNNLMSQFGGGSRLKKSNHIDMNERDLKKLSKSELIDLLLKKERKNKPKIIIVDDTKPSPKRKTPIPTTCKSVKQMAKEYEENIILPPPEFRDYHKPITTPRTKRHVVKKPVPTPRTKIEQTENALKGYTNQYKKQKRSINSAAKYKKSNRIFCK